MFTAGDAFEIMSPIATKNRFSVHVHMMNTPTTFMCNGWQILLE